jgi:hypothetical protein
LSSRSSLRAVATGRAVSDGPGQQAGITLFHEAAVPDPSAGRIVTTSHRSPLDRHVAEPDARVGEAGDARRSACPTMYGAAVPGRRSEGQVTLPNPCLKCYASPAALGLSHSTARTARPLPCPEEACEGTAALADFHRHPVHATHRGSPASISPGGCGENPFAEGLVFHGHLTAAPLKRGERQSVPAWSVAFRDREVAAPSERPRVGDEGLWRAVFHGPLTVAPLKPVPAERLHASPVVSSTVCGPCPH